MVVYADIEKRHGELKNKRAREEPVWRRLARHLRPDGQEFSSGERRERDAVDDPFDSTPLYALDDFVGGTFVKSMNPAERWFEVAIGDKDLMKWKPVATWLFAYADVIYRSLHPSRDNFYLAAPAWIADMGAFGDSFLWQEEDVGKGRIITRAMPLGQMFKDVDANDNTDTLHREYKLSGLQAKREFGDIAKDLHDTREYAFIHAISPNDDYRPGAIGPRGFPFRSCTVSPDAKDFSRVKGYYELPGHELQWNVRAGRPWATGPGHNALADMGMLDEMSRSVIVGLQFAAEPMILARDETVMTTADIVPGNVLYGGMTEQGKRQIDALNTAENLTLPLQAQEIIRNNIRKAFYFGLMQLINRPQMTATEVMGFKEEELKLLGPNLVRIHRGLASFIARRARILNAMDNGTGSIVPPPPPELRGQSIGIEFVSPFAKAMEMEKARGAMNWVNDLAGKVQLTGDPSWMDEVDPAGYSAVTHSAFSGIPSIKRDPREVAQIRQNRAAAQQQAIEVEQSAQMSQVDANMAHAEQARTLARQRTR